MDGYGQVQCLAQAVEEISGMVRPMGGHLGSHIEMTAYSPSDEMRGAPAVRLFIGFSEELLTQYIAGSYPQEGDKAGKSNDRKGCSTLGQAPA
jgi:hypothetical protein